MSAEHATIRQKIVSNPPEIAGIQDDWWTGISPLIWDSKGTYLKDRNGKEYLDLNGFFSTAVVRFDHPDLRSKAFTDKLLKSSFYRPSLSDFWTGEMAEFIAAFREIAVPPYMHHLFFIEGGSLAVENALKAAFDWKVRLNMKKGIIKSDPVNDKRPLGTKVIYFKNAFHGRSGYTLSLTNTADPRKTKYFPKFDWFAVDPPVFSFNCEGEISNIDEANEQLQKSVNEIKNIIRDNPHDIAAIIIEPIQAEGGDRHIPMEFFIELRKIADENEIILIYDEVQTGMGATGKMWCHEHFGEEARPDVVAFCKKAQIGGIMANYQKFSIIPDNVFLSSDESLSRLNSTWGGNPVDMVRSTALLGIMKKESLLDNARDVGTYFRTGLHSLCKEFSDLIENPRGKGMMLAFDAKVPQHQGEIFKAFLKQDLLSITCGKRSIRFRPHLDLQQSDVDEAIVRMRKALAGFSVN